MMTDGTIVISVPMEDLDATGRVILEAGRWCKIFYADEGSAIIRCKDCKWKQGSECVRFADVRPFPDDFCSRAERRTDE